jgi:DNA-binding MarR family transcriptional regulator
MAETQADGPTTDARHLPRTLYLIKQVQYKTYVRLEDALAPSGITTAQFRILFTLAHRTRRSSAELSRMFGVKPQTMIKQIAILEAGGLIGRAMAPSNKRVLEVELTEQGTRVLAEANARAIALEDEIFSVLSPEELDQYRAAMIKLLGNLPQTDHEAGEYQLTREAMHEVNKPR